MTEKNFLFSLLLPFYILFFILLISIAILSSSSVNAVGIQYPSAADRLIVFQPGIERHLSFTLVNAEYIRSYKNAGILDEYVTIIDSAQDSGPRNIEAVIRLPQSLDPGKYEIFIGGSEMASRDGTVGALTAVQARITVLSLYPGQYPEFALSTSDLGVNQSVNFTIIVQNFGIEPILKAQGFIDIYDVENNLVVTLITDSKSVAVKLDNPSESTTLNTVFDASKYVLKPGIYYARAKLVYDGVTHQEIKESTFRLGTLYVYVRDWTKNVFIESTNKLQIMIASDWSSPIDDVYAKITTPNKGVIKTPNLDMNKFSEATLETYWETEGLALGDYDLGIELFYGGQSSKTTVKVSIIDGVPPPIVESPKESFKLNIDTTTLILVLMVIILVFNVYFFMFKGRGQNQQQYSQPPKYSQPPQSDLINNSIKESSSTDSTIRKKDSKSTTQSLKPPRL